ncbi:MAG TPA: hypothetical protein PKD09_18530 [Aggregatilinea sp.]|uniref:hypothetical protein n=1 Tax=Aggregatilinea sp. TaxID=2806333 RepID=UPI002B678E1F|nr:hypothetical protein [Aggregatilinea sp.]HML23659.1 hypothetical protein [Aggregatilinea sp.]
MDQATESALRRAYLLIKAGDRDGARALIMPVLASERDNIDAWWLAAHAAPTPPDVRVALDQVLRLNPEHQAARVMGARLSRLHPELVLADKPAAKRAPTVHSGPSSHRWVWNVVLVAGLAAFAFGGAALVSSVMGLTWLNDAVTEVGETVGLDTHSDETYGTVTLKDAGAAPVDYTITQIKSAPKGDVATGNMLEKEAHVWTFSAEQGQDVMAMVQFTVAGNAAHVVELLDVEGRTLAQGVGMASDSGTVTLVYTLTQTGSYKLVIFGRPGGPRGAYALGLDVS